MKPSSSLMRTTVPLVLAAILVAAFGVPLAGCKRHKASPAPAASAPGLPSAQQPVPTNDLEMLNQAMSRYVEISPVPPSDIADLYRVKLIPRVPVPPPGKKYVVDKISWQVSLENQ